MRRNGNAKGREKKKNERVCFTRASIHQIWSEEGGGEVFQKGKRQLSTLLLSYFAAGSEEIAGEGKEGGGALKKRVTSFSMAIVAFCIYMNTIPTGRRTEKKEKEV